MSNAPFSDSTPEVLTPRKIPGVYLYTKRSEDGSAKVVVWNWSDGNFIALMMFLGGITFLMDFIFLKKCAGGDFTEKTVIFASICLAITIAFWCYIQQNLPVFFAKQKNGDLWVFRLLNLPQKIRKDDLQGWLVQRKNGTYNKQDRRDVQWAQTKAYLLITEENNPWPFWGLFRVRDAGKNNIAVSLQMEAILKAIGPTLGIPHIKML